MMIIPIVLVLFIPAIMVTIYIIIANRHGKNSQPKQQDCELKWPSQWEDCDASCGDDGLQHKQAKIKSNAANGGKACPQPLPILTQSCSAAPCHRHPEKIPLIGGAGNFDQRISVRGVGFSPDDPMKSYDILFDTGNHNLIYPYWNDLKNNSDKYNILGSATERWGCPVYIVTGPMIVGGFTIQNCTFLACYQDHPHTGSRTSNFGAGYISRTRIKLGDVYVDTPFRYVPNINCIEINFANNYVMLYNDISQSLTTLLGYPNMLNITPNYNWMSTYIKYLSLNIKNGDNITKKWIDNLDNRHVYIDSGGGPILMSDPSISKCYSYRAAGHHFTTIPSLTSREECVNKGYTWSESDSSIIHNDDIPVVTHEKVETWGTKCGVYNFPSYVDVTLTDKQNVAIIKIPKNNGEIPGNFANCNAVICEQNRYLFSKAAMNIGGQLFYYYNVLIDYRDPEKGGFKIGFKPSNFTPKPKMFTSQLMFGGNDGNRKELLKYIMRFKKRTSVANK